MQTHELLLAAALVAGGACLASLRSPASAALQPGSEPAAKVYEVDRVHSGVVFRVMHLETAWVFGRFNDFKGTLTYDEQNPENSSVEVEIAATSIDTASRRRDDHLRSADFFDATQFPTVTFKSTKAKDLGEGRLELTGDLTLRGHTETITFPIQRTGSGQIHRGQELIGFYGELEIDRMAHGVSYMPEGLGTKVHVMVSLEAAARGESD